MNFFIFAFIVLCLICGILFYYTHSKIKTPNDENFKHLQNIYVLIYVLAMAGDWLQGPYVYALYEHYKMSKREIEMLFVAGFGSSMVFGTFIGSFADKIGRRKNCLLYGVLYAASCMTKHFPNFQILMVGRILGGVATSLLYSSFESWLLSRYNKLSVSSEHLGTIFSHAYLGNSVIAILAGVLSQYSVDYLGFVAPFDIAIVVLTIMNGLIILLWDENYGNEAASFTENFRIATKSIFTDKRILCLGLIQALFEGSMYCFVLEWTPALASHSSDSKVDGHRGSIPHGYIFAAFMVAMMIGSCGFKVLDRLWSPEFFLQPVLCVAAFCLSLPVWVSPGHTHLLFLAFVVFETCIGVFWPSLGTLRAKYVPEEVRATIMNCFRVPLNLIVVLILCQNFAIKSVFLLCTVFLIISALLQYILYRTSTNPTNETQDAKKIIGTV